MRDLETSIGITCIANNGVHGTAEKLTLAGFGCTPITQDPSLVLRLEWMCSLPIARV